MRTVTLWLTTIGLLSPLVGCFSTIIEPPPQDRDINPTSQLAGTIWEDSVRDRALLQGLDPLSVRGYGLVVGLGDRGSRRTPPSVRSFMLQEMRRLKGAVSPRAVDLYTSMLWEIWSPALTLLFRMST